ncbi:PfkB family carbohydrate kinase [Metabacillus litoralis]|uniref:PfkB family carbohydrate kinase n=1 Tax=Metabacillus TaxID=2675233 RepID=UPI001B96D36B|nr:PfkB family carbohydrate kinase [Metabacillus litoralis]UHA58844.1 PfkB family carbohydrate kinase [Metabacillus litoralis]
MKLITIGDNVVDCYLDQHNYYPGGNCVNVAVNAKRNGASEVSYIGIFGNDEQAEHIKYVLRQEGVDYQYSRDVIGITGQPQVTLTEDHDRVFVGGPKNTVQHKFKIQLIQEELDYIKNFDLSHVSCYSSMESELAKLSKVAKVSYDFSNRKDLPYIESISPYISYAFFSAAELSDEELEKFINDLRSFQFEIIGLTRGGKPAIFIKNGEMYEQKLKKIDVVDTMGAGDSLIAGFLTAYMNGDEIEAAIEKGTKSAEKTCQEYGGFGYPKEMQKV